VDAADSAYGGHRQLLRSRARPTGFADGPAPFPSRRARLTQKWPPGRPNNGRLADALAKGATYGGFEAGATLSLLPHNRARLVSLAAPASCCTHLSARPSPWLGPPRARLNGAFPRSLPRERCAGSAGVRPWLPPGGAGALRTPTRLYGTPRPAPPDSLHGRGPPFQRHLRAPGLRGIGRSNPLSPLLSNVVFVAHRSPLRSYAGYLPPVLTRTPRTLISQNLLV
jgi:hypothetical protein